MVFMITCNEQAQL